VPNGIKVVAYIELDACYMPDHICNWCDDREYWTHGDVKSTFTINMDTPDPDTLPMYNYIIALASVNGIYLQSLKDYEGRVLVIVYPT